MIRINCQYATDFCQCYHPKRKKVLGLFSKRCVAADGNVCDLQKSYLRPDPPKSGSGVPSKIPIKAEIVIKEKREKRKK